MSSNYNSVQSMDTANKIDTDLDVTDQKSIRLMYRRIRANIDDRELKNRWLVNNVMSFIRDKRRDSRYAFYYALAEEASLNSIIFDVVKNNLDIKIHLPHIKSNYYFYQQSFNAILDFAMIHSGCRFHPNKFGIMEPFAHRYLPARFMDYVFVPLTCFDDRGNRIGMGKGFYDQTFAFKRLNFLCKPWLIGIAYEAQKHPKPLPSNPFDVPLNWLITEKRIIKFNPH